MIELESPQIAESINAVNSCKGVQIAVCSAGATTGQGRGQVQMNHHDAKARVDQSEDEMFCVTILV